MLSNCEFSMVIIMLCTWYCTCDIIGSILTTTVVSLWVVLIKLPFENTEETGDPVVQSYV